MFVASLSSQQVPVDVQEKFILSGYRPLGTSFIYGLKSIFFLHNETLNVWTHIVPLVYFFYYLCIDTALWKRLDGIPKHVRLPLYGYIAGVCILFATSSFAHLCSCAWSRKWREVCFMLDYAAITVYGTSCAIVYYLYNKPKQGVEHTILFMTGDFYMGFIAVTGVFGMWVCCYTRLNPSHLGYTIRTCAFGLPAVLGSFPAIFRFYTEIFTPSRASVIDQGEAESINKMTEQVAPVRNTLSSNQPISEPIVEELRYCWRFILHSVIMIGGAVINVIKVPERWWPGMFDIFGHSHQWFHVCIFLSIREQFWLIMDDISMAHRLAHLEQAFSLSCASSMLGLLLMVIICILATISWFGFCHPFKMACQAHHVANTLPQDHENGSQNDKNGQQNDQFATHRKEFTNVKLKST